MATKSTPLKRKLESDSDTPRKKRNWLSLEDKLDIIKSMKMGLAKLKATHFCKTCEENLCKFYIIKHYKNKFFNKDHKMIPI